MVQTWDGKLLVALPALEDPSFERAVVLLLDHDDEGALGVVLNRPTAVPVAEVLVGWDQLVAVPQRVFGGGPVEPRAVVGLGVARLDSARGGTVIGRIRTVDPNADPGEMRSELEWARFFAGYAGWAPGQLEDEVEAGAWVVVDAIPTDVVTDHPEELWNTVLGRQDGGLRLLASFPEDPRLN